MLVSERSQLREGAEVLISTVSSMRRVCQLTHF